MTGFVSAYIREFDKDSIISESENIQSKLRDYNLRIDNVFGESRHNINYNKSRLLSVVKKVGTANTLIITDIKHINMLSDRDFEVFRRVIESDYIRLVVLNLPATYRAISVPNPMLNRRVQHGITKVLIEAIHAMCGDDSFNNNDQEDDIPDSTHIGRRPNIDLYKKILALVDKGATYKEINRELSCSSSTVVKAKNWRLDNP